MKKIKYYSILNSSNLSDYHFLFIQISESSIKRILGCKNNREKSSTTELGEELHTIIEYLHYAHLMIKI